jgi:hypothetical protein
VGAVGHVELGEDVGHVVADRLGAEDQAAGDGLVVQAPGDEVEDVVLPLGQLGERPAGRAAAAGEGQLGDGLRHVVVEHDVAGGCGPQRAS